MEDKMNSAVEKVETSAADAAENRTQNAAQSGGQSTAKTRKTGTRKNISNGTKKTKSGLKRTKTATSKKIAAQKSAGHETGANTPRGVRAEQIRVKKDELKAERKAAAAKARAAAKEQRRIAAENRKEQRRLAAENKKEQRRARKASLAEKRLAKREERIRRRDMLKSESKADRRDRLAREREEKIRLRREKAEIRARLISQKRENKRILKQQKREQRAADRTQKRSRGIGGWLAAVISLGCSTLLLATLFTFNALYMSGSKNLLNGTYERAYYELAGCVDNIDVNLGKLAVSATPRQQQKILTDIIVQSELAESELQTLPLEDSSKYSTGKYINQLGDFSKSLSYKLADGGEITAEDREILAELSRRNSNLQQALTKISAEMGKNFKFTSLLKPEEDNVITTNMNELENNSLQYPKMIYDGPFSDGLERRTPRGLEGTELTRKEALESFKSIFSEYAVKDAEVVNESDGDIPTYNIEAKNEDGSLMYAQISKQGGRPVMFHCYEPCDKDVFTLEECREVAEVFVKKAGFEGMKPVWQTASRAVAQFNFAYEQNGVVCYPDLVKVNVCMERGIVSAVEAESYFLNHTERTLPAAAISPEAARQKAEGLIEVRSVRTALVPVGSGEKLAYEIFGTSGGSQYFVYVDAQTGREIEIFKVIESTEGMLLI